LELLQKNDILDVRLGDHVDREMTIMFVDIEGFTALAESMDSFSVFTLINRYLRQVGPVVRKQGGFIDKYIGDAIMALFPQPSDAVRAAVELLQVLKTFNGTSPEGTPELAVGIGIHCGSVCFGVLGEDQRMQGTVIGDAVNVAARIEGLTRKYHARVLISEAAKQLLADDAVWEFRFIDKVPIRGRRGTTGVWEVVVSEDASGCPDGGS